MCHRSGTINPASAESNRVIRTDNGAMRFWSGVTRRRAVPTAGLGLALAVVLASCGANKYTYIDNGKENTYIRVPSAWKVFNVNGDGVRPAALPDSVETIWHVAFDASTKPSVKHTTAIDALPPASVDKPVGQLQIYNVQGSFNQELSLSTARSTVLGIDPLGVPDDVKDLVEIVSYTPIARDGLQGSRVVYNLHNEGDPWQTVDATTLFDQSRNRFYVLRIGCTSECFKDNQNAISQIATSWKVVR
jgi:hypothetical protein